MARINISVPQLTSRHIQGVEPGRYSYSGIRLASAGNNDEFIDLISRLGIKIAENENRIATQHSELASLDMQNKFDEHNQQLKEEIDLGRPVTSIQSREERNLEYKKRSEELATTLGNLLDPRAQVFYKRHTAAQLAKSNLDFRALSSKRLVEYDNGLLVDLREAYSHQLINGTPEQKATAQAKWDGAIDGMLARGSIDKTKYAIENNLFNTQVATKRMDYLVRNDDFKTFWKETQEGKFASVSPEIQAKMQERAWAKKDLLAKSSDSAAKKLEEAVKFTVEADLNDNLLQLSTIEMGRSGKHPIIPDPEYWDRILEKYYKNPSSDDNVAAAVIMNKFHSLGARTDENILTALNELNYLTENSNRKTHPAIIALKKELGGYLKANERERALDRRAELGENAAKRAEENQQNTRLVRSIEKAKDDYRYEFPPQVSLVPQFDSIMIKEREKVIQEIETRMKNGETADKVLDDIRKRERSKRSAVPGPAAQKAIDEAKDREQLLRRR